MGNQFFLKKMSSSTTTASISADEAAAMSAYRKASRKTLDHDQVRPLLEQVVMGMTIEMLQSRPSPENIEAVCDKYIDGIIHPQSSTPPPRGSKKSASHESTPNILRKCFKQMMYVNFLHLMQQAEEHREEILGGKK